ncbi:MAG: beta-lactamase family protein [Sphingobacteriales bacterium]|nr:beta-lactamase family protein [Sphingobacteriales bacterium]
MSISLVACGSTGNKPAMTATDSIAVTMKAAATAISMEDSDRLSKTCEYWYNRNLKNPGFNGGIVVAKNGHIVFEKYKGTGHLKARDSITENTAFHIASVSKTFTAMAVLKLWQEGKLNMDEEFSKYYPEFNYPGVTIRSMLNHRSGLPNYVHYLEQIRWNQTKFATNEDVLSTLIRYKGRLQNTSAPNRHFEYCNTNYALLALLVEKISGKKFPDYLNETFFIPLGMKNTKVFLPTDIGHVTPSYDWNGFQVPFNYLDVVYGDKNVYSTPRDLLLWDRGLVSGGLFSPATLAEAYAGYSHEKDGIKNYGLGWRMNEYPNGKKIIFHNGWWHGNNASFIRLLQDSATIIVLGNKFNGIIYHAKELAGLFGNYGGGSMSEEGETSTTTTVRHRTRTVARTKNIKTKKTTGKAPKKARTVKKPRVKKRR